MAQDAFSITPFGNGNPHWFLGTAAPTTGSYDQGDIVWNSAPAAAGVLCYVCTTAGSPGTWKTVSINA